MPHWRTHAQLTPDKPAYIMARTGEVVTFQKLEERANRCSQFFRAIGLRPKDHIAIMMENNARYLEITSAAQVAGLIYTAISTHLTTPEIEYIVNDCEAKVFITSPYKADVAKELLDRMPKVPQRLSVGGAIEGYRSYEETVAAYPVTPIPEDIEGRDMLYSSGTTGRPKGIVSAVPDLPFGEISPGVALLSMLYGLNTEAVYLSPAPLYHSAPLRFCMCTLRMGGTVVVMEHFDPEEALVCIEKYKVTTSQWVPTMFIRMLKLPEEVRKKYDISSLKLAIHAAAPCPIPVKEQMIEWWGPIIFEYYAGTEGNLFIAITSQEWLTHKGSVGLPYGGTLHILDENENELPPGEQGGVYIENGMPFEYHNDPNKTRSSKTSKGWSTMGDIGFVDNEGYLYLTDRKADMIISGGVNIYPQEAENVLATHPRVADVAVFGIPNEDFGEEVKAVVQPTNMADAGPALEQELLSFCQQNLAKIKCPRSIDFEKELPRYPTGKLFKRLLKERYWNVLKK
ncbi:MAG: AMP-binding protein [Deltaproteobacteria bacterium]|nr:AMP-binding protein [Deltaproteobacteria bacterium]